MTRHQRLPLTMNSIIPIEQIRYCGIQILARIFFQINWEIEYKLLLSFRPLVAHPLVPTVQIFLSKDIVANSCCKIAFALCVPTVGTC